MAAEAVSLSKRSKLWLTAVMVAFGVFVTAALVLPQSFRLTALTDVLEAALLVSGLCSFVPLVLHSKGRMRLFWSLIIFGIALWTSYQLLWTYFETVLRRDVPDLFVGDVILFLNLVPAMAALALRPHTPRDEYAARLGRLDFALLLVWWLYVYVLIVMPWQFVVADIQAYNHNLNSAYSVEKFALLAGLAASWWHSTGPWRKFYASFFGMTLCYSASSALANWAIGRNVYYSGSWYDIPLAIAMVWVTWIGLSTKAEAPDTDAREVSTVYGVWVARCSMIAVFSLPLFGIWAMTEADVPSRIILFRLTLTLIAAFGMGVMVMIRQSLLDRELMHLLNHSRDSVENLKRLQAQILQSEKLASIGQLVGGAAHELNNPITAMLGYSDLLLGTKLTEEQQPIAAKIGQYVRRTRSLVASLISFARQTPAPKTAIDLNTLARTAIKLTQPQCETLGIKVHTNFDNQLPKVLGDSNQLLQVCLQLVGNCLHVMGTHGDRVLTIGTEFRAGISVLQIATGSISASEQNGSPETDGSLGLSACQGILQEHHGRVAREVLQDGSLHLCVELPATESSPPKPKETTVPVLWQSRPFA